MPDPYLIDNTRTLKNKLGITNKELLEYAESDITYLKLLDIDNWFEKESMEYETFLAIHKYIFEDIYSWAGDLRCISVFKEESVLGGPSLDYGEVNSLEESLRKVIDEMNSVSWSNMGIDEIVPLFTDFVARLWLIHPFREGNTRTVMRFAGLYAQSNGFPLNSKLLRDKADYVRKALVLYCVKEAPEKEFLLRIMKDAINSY